MNSTVEWPVVSIKDVCESVVDCVNKTAPTVDYQTPYKMIRTTNVRDGWVNLDEVRFVEAEVFARWNRRTTPRKGDVILTREAPLGEVGMLRSNDHVFLGQRLVLYRADPLKLDNRFLLYSFRFDYLQGQIKSLGSGATVEHMRVPDAEKLLLRLPPLPIQRRIGDILSAYDDLIENNARRITILEKIAKMLYRGWFVDFRFPGHKKVAVVNSGGLVGPDGWERTVVERACVSVGDGDWIETKDQGGNSYRLLQVSNIGLNAFVETDNYRFVSEETFQRLRCNEVLPGDILVARMPTPIGRAWLVTPQEWRMITAVDVAILRAKEATSLFLLHFLNSAETLATCSAQASGTTRERITRKQIASLPVLLPPEEVRLQFARIVAPMNELMGKLRSLNHKLYQTLNLLLPKLISGEVSVEQCETEAVAQGV